MRWRTPAAAALSHARRGWVMVPLRPGTGLPARKWAHLQSTSPGAVAAWWPGPQHNPGIATGPSGLVVIDLDSAQHNVTLTGEWAESGITHGSEVLAVLACRARQAVPATYEVTTPRGGRHLYFRAPAGVLIRNSAGRLGPLVDVRGSGGLVVAAGAVKNGRAYEVADDHPPVLLPQWLAELASTQPRAQPDRTTTAPSVTGHGYGAAALRAELAALAATGRGHRNHQLNAAAFSLGTLIGSGVLEEASVTRRLLATAEAIGLVTEDGIAQCQRTIASGMAAGIAQPRNRRAA